jgi:hypothetical protein
MRGGYFVLGGIAAIGFGQVIGMSVQVSAMERLQRGGSPQELMRDFQGLTASAVFAKLIFFGGVIAAIAGVVLMIVQSSQGQKRGTSSLSLEEENRRLREELERQKNQN